MTTPAAMTEGDLAFRRLQLGPAAVMSLTEAARLLPMGEGRAREWLRQEQLVRDLDGRSVVIWGDVLDHLRRVPVQANKTPIGKSPVKRSSFR